MKVALLGILTLLSGSVYAADQIPDNRDQRSIQMEVLKTDQDQTVVLTNGTASTFVASASKGDQPDAFALPISVKRETSDLALRQERDANGQWNKVANPVEMEGVKGVFAFSDHGPNAGSARVSIWDSSSNAPQVVEMALKEGKNTQRFGSYTVNLTVSPLQ